ncbi:MAG TPA: hypothetical protein VIX62_04030 [Actinomycetota bacterium]|jgi:hypothetical protein
MRTPARSRWLIALVAAVAVVSIATVAAATRGGSEQEHANDGSGQVSAGSPGDPNGSVAIDPVHGDCNVAPLDRNADPDSPVDYAVCPDDQDPAPWGDPSTAQPVEPTPGMAGVRARPFDRAMLNDDGTVTILFTSGVEPCAVLDHVTVDEGDAVTITLYEGHDPDAGDVACIEIAVLKSVTITLDHPLDGRSIVDGAA